MGSKIDALFRGAVLSPRPGISLATALDGGWLGSIRLGARSTLGEVAARQARFSIDPASGLASAVTAGAQKVVAGPNGDATLRAVAGLRSSLNADGGANELVVFALSDSGRGMAINTMRNVELGSRGAALRIPATADAALGATISRAVRSDGRLWMLRLGGANAEQGRIAVGPSLSKAFTRAVDDAVNQRSGLLARRRGDMVAYMLRHEGEHTVTSTRALNIRILKWEEAIADTLARWPGTSAETATNMGIAHSAPSRLSWVRQPLKGYVDYAANMRTLLHMAGVDTRVVANRAVAAELLQATPTEHNVARRLAERMIDAHGVSAGSVDEVAERIVTAASDRRELKRLAHDLGATDALSVMREMRRDTVVGMAMDPIGAAAIVGTSYGAFELYRTGRSDSSTSRIPGTGELLRGAGLVAGAYAGSRIGGIRVALPLGLLAAGSIAGTTVDSID